MDDVGKYGPIAMVLGTAIWEGSTGIVGLPRIDNENKVFGLIAGLDAMLVRSDEDIMGLVANSLRLSPPAAKTF